MKKLFLVAIVTTIASNIFGQIKQPVNFTFSSVKKAGNSYQVSITASLEKGWHIYAQNTPDGGPVPTKISFAKNPFIQLVGKTAEVGKLQSTHDKNFGINVLYYSNSVVFTQNIILKKPIATNITGEIEYMLCDDEKCLPPSKKSFSIAIK